MKALEQKNPGGARLLLHKLSVALGGVKNLNELRSGKRKGSDTSVSDVDAGSSQTGDASDLEPMPEKEAFSCRSRFEKCFDLIQTACFAAFMALLFSYATTLRSPREYFLCEPRPPGSNPREQQQQQASRAGQHTSKRAVHVWCVVADKEIEDRYITNDDLEFGGITRTADIFEWGDQVLLPGLFGKMGPCSPRDGFARRPAGDVGEKGWFNSAVSAWNESVEEEIIHDALRFASGASGASGAQSSGSSSSHKGLGRRAEEASASGGKWINDTDIPGVLERKGCNDHAWPDGANNLALVNPTPPTIATLLAWEDRPQLRKSNPARKLIMKSRTHLRPPPTPATRRV